MTERYDHIDHHFMGRNSDEKRSIENWMRVDKEPRRQVATQEMKRSSATAFLVVRKCNILQVPGLSFLILVLHFQDYITLLNYK